MLAQDFLTGLIVNHVQEGMSRRSIVETISHQNIWLQGYVRSVLAEAESFEDSMTTLTLHQNALVSVVGNFLAHVAAPQMLINCLHCNTRAVKRIEYRNETKLIESQSVNALSANITICGPNSPAIPHQEIIDLVERPLNGTDLTLICGDPLYIERVLKPLENITVSSKPFRLCETIFILSLIRKNGLKL